jgi:hypothetical protein
MGSTTAAGTAIAISVASPATHDAAGYGALTFTEIGGPDKLGALGEKFAKVEWKPLKGPIDKHKGSVDNGSLQPNVAIDEDDAGQGLLRTAAADKTSKLYSFKVTYATGAIRYFGGRVFSNDENTDNADSVLTTAPMIEICTDIVRVPAP